MPDNSLINSAAFAQRTAQLELQLRRFFGFLSRVPLARWQWLITFLLVIWLSHSLARLFWLIIPTPVIPPATVTSVASTLPGASPAGGAEAINIAQVKNLAPFGETNAEPAAAVEAQQTPATQGIENNAADTQLNLILRGVLSSNDEKAARAIIATGDKADVYGIGDTLPAGNNVTLAKVLDLRVIINNNGSFESLWMYKDDPNAPKLGAVAAPPAGNPAVSGGYANPPYQQQPPVLVDKSSSFNSPAQAAAGDPGMAQVGKTLADVVAMSIYRENGQVVGYKIRPGRNAQKFTELGLQTDDIVTAVNGVPLSSPGKIMEIYKSMGSATSANLEIRRGGSTVNLDVML
ncbi:type II secretion system protein GspC [Cellvibrio mixtus]|uniref:type II secretion system protein GspC n=1 Tax=Cellvibrio mixtus TaxID=39650 RepID=UPI000587BB45|nr:type II secretion system protein GspC [Cellvibrio mixtus]